MLSGEELLRCDMPLPQVGRSGADYSSVLLNSECRDGLHQDRGAPTKCWQRKKRQQQQQQEEKLGEDFCPHLHFLSWMLPTKSVAIFLGEAPSMTPPYLLADGAAEEQHRSEEEHAIEECTDSN